MRHSKCAGRESREPQPASTVFARWRRNAKAREDSMSGGAQATNWLLSKLTSAVTKMPIWLRLKSKPGLNPELIVVIKPANQIVARLPRSSKALANADRWKQLARRHPDGYYTLQTEDTGAVPVRMFLTPSLFESAEDILYRQIVNATSFPGVRMVVITPDVHYGYGVPVGCVLITDARNGAVAMGPVGYDIGCGMMSARSDAPAGAATPEKRLQFNRAVMQRVSMGAGGKSHRLGKVSQGEFYNLVRGGAEYYVKRYGAAFDRSHAERHRIPVD